MEGRPIYGIWHVPSLYWGWPGEAGAFGRFAKGGEDMSGMRGNRMRNDGRRKRISVQRMVQILSAVIINGYAVGFARGKIFTGKSKAFCVPVLNCYSCPGALGACPIGSLQAALGGRHFPFYVLGSLMLFGIVLGRLACGMLCPFGLVQDLLYKIPVPKWNVPKRVDRPARYLKYVVLFVFVIVLPIFAVSENGVAIPYFCKYICPAGTLGGGLPLMAANPRLRDLIGFLFDWKVMVLAAILVSSMFVSRPFCRYLCPLGAFYSIFNKFGFYQMKLDENACIGCGRCERACPMAVEVTKDINGPECIRCGKCKAVCPTKAISSGFCKRSNLVQSVREEG